MAAQIKKQLAPGETLVECAISVPDRPDFARARLLGLLELDPKPIALVGICIRPDAATLAAFRSAGIPVVLVDEEADGASTVASDNVEGGYLAGKHLAGLGRRSIALVSGKLHIDGGYNAVQRAKGFQKAMLDHGLPFSMREVIEAPDYSRKDGMAAMTALLSGLQKIDAIFCAAGDACATGMLAVARERRVKIPEEIAIIGYDDSPLAAIADPPLSTIRQSMDRIAHEAHRLATQATAEILARPKTVLVEPKLVLRQSA
jgi:DNA-binding LacI/PurR family transcriptional regulator